MQETHDNKVGPHQSRSRSLFQEGVWQHVIHCRDHMHCTVRANQVTKFKYVTLIDNVLTKQWPLDKALDVARVRVDYRICCRSRERWQKPSSLCLCTQMLAIGRVSTLHCILPFIPFITLRSQGTHTNLRTDTTAPCSNRQRPTYILVHLHAGSGTHLH